MSSHPIGDERKAITADHGIFVVLTKLPDVSTTCSSQSGHESLLGMLTGDGKRWVHVGGEELASKSEGFLAVARVGFELSRPDAKLFLGGLTQERADVGERHTRVTERIDHQGLNQLTW
jgi:hypothetical protein